MPRGKKSVGQVMVEFCDAELEKRQQAELPSIQYPSEAMKKRYNMYRSFFPELKLIELNRDCTADELSEKLLFIKHTVCSEQDDEEQTTSTNIDHIVQKSLKVTFTVIEKALLRFIDCRGFSDDISQHKQMLRLTKSLLVESDYISKILSMLIKSSGVENINVQYQITMLVLWTLYGTVNRNREKGRITTEDLRREMESLKNGSSSSTQ